MIMIPSFVCKPGPPGENSLRAASCVSRNGGDVVPCDCDHAAAGQAGAGPDPGAPGSRVPVRGTRTRGTKQAQALAAALQSLPGFCSAQEIHAQLRRKGEHVGLTTVYRHLQSLSEQGSIDTIRDANGEILYRQCETSDHHHHLTCRSCGCSVEVEGRAVEQWAERVAAEAGFTNVGHTVELFGLCPDCAPS